MEFKKEFLKCIVCLNQPCGGWEHVIPEIIGGKLKGRMLCDHCNNSFGSSLVSKLKCSDSIQMAIESLNPKLPSLYEKYFSEITYVGKATDGSTIHFANPLGGLKIKNGPGKSNSVILDTNDAEKAIKTKLRRFGFSTSEIEKWVKRFNHLAEDNPLEIPTGEIFIKHHTPVRQRELGKSKIDDRLYVLMAFEFLSLLIGDCIFSPSFDPVRSFIKGEDNINIVGIQHFRSGNEYRPFHKISVRPSSNKVCVDIRLFSWITSVVTFSGFDYLGPDSVYIEDLANSQSRIAQTHNDANQGNWFVINYK